LIQSSLRLTYYADVILHYT